ncbi:MAG: hypothetical protein ACW99A_15340, partial [Candidatus Kariarchaeaceae archaeon]
MAGKISDRNEHPGNIISNSDLELIRRITLDKDQHVNTEELQQLNRLYTLEFVSKIGKLFSPSFVLIFEDELLELHRVAKKIGEEIAKVLIDKIQIPALYQSLSALQKFEFKRLGFILVGDLFLDDGMLEIFWKDGSLLPNPPLRQTGGKYYLWAVEDSYVDLGGYGQSSDSIGDGQFRPISFGSYKNRFSLPNAYWDLLEGNDRKEIDELVERTLQEYIVMYNNPDYKSSNDAVIKLESWNYLADEKINAPVFNTNDQEIIAQANTGLSKYVLE